MVLTRALGQRQILEADRAGLTAARDGDLVQHRGLDVVAARRDDFLPGDDAVDSPGR